MASHSRPGIVLAGFPVSASPQTGGIRYGEPLLVQGEITYYQSQGTASVLLGRQKIAVMHVTATTSSGAKAADFLAIATSDALRTDDAELADSLARSVASYFKQKLPKTPGGT